MNRIQIAIFIAVLGVSLSLNSMNNSDLKSPESLTQLCLNFLASNPKRTQIVQKDDGSTPVDQVISAIRYGNYDDSLKLKLSQTLSIKDVEPYIEELWDFVKTFNMNTIQEDQNACFLLFKDIINTLPKKFFDKHVHELIELPNISQAIKCFIICQIPLLQTPDMFQSVCRQGPITNQLAQLMAKSFSIDHALAYKKGEFYHKEMLGHGNERRLLQVHIKEFNDSEPRIQFKNNKAFLILEPHIIRVPTESGKYQKIEKIREYPIETLDDILTLRIFFITNGNHYSEYFNDSSQPICSINPVRDFLLKIDQRYNQFTQKTQEILPLIKNGKYDQLRSFSKNDLKELDIIILDFNKITLSEIPEPLISKYVTLKEVFHNMITIIYPVIKEMQEIDEQLDVYSNDLIDCLQCNCFNNVNTDFLFKKNIDNGLEKLKKNYATLDKINDIIKNKHKTILTILHKALNHIDVLTKKYFKQKGKRLQTFINNYIQYILPLLETFEKQKPVIYELLNYHPGFMGEPSFYFLNLSLKSLDDSISKSILPIKFNVFSQLYDLSDEGVDRACKSAETFAHLLEKFKQSNPLPCFQEIIEYFELYRTKVLPILQAKQAGLLDTQPQINSEEQPQEGFSSRFKWCAIV